MCVREGEVLFINTKNLGRRMELLNSIQFFIASLCRGEGSGRYKGNNSDIIITTVS